MFCIFSSLALILVIFAQYNLRMTNEKSKPGQINLIKKTMCLCLNWFMKVSVSPPSFYFRFIFV